MVQVSEGTIDQVMSMLNEADPTLPESDPTGIFLYWNIYSIIADIKYEICQI